MLEVKQLSKVYGNQRGVKDISFSMTKGEIVGFLGANGAGKTTTMRLITGYLHPTNGEVSVDGLTMEKNAREVRRKIGYLPQVPPVYPDMTVLRYMKFIAELREIPKRERLERIHEVLDRLGFSGREHQVISTLSGGFKQRLGLAQAIIHNPELLILDEPTNGLDPKQIIEVRDLIREIGKERTVLLSTHILQEVESICNRILIIHDGQMVLDSKSDTIKQSLKDGFEITLMVRGEQASIGKALLTLPEINQVRWLPSLMGDAANTVRLRIEANADIREALFFALAAEGYPLLELSLTSLSLEDIFIQLTAGDSKVSEPTSAQLKNDLSEPAEPAESSEQQTEEEKKDE